MLASSQRNSWEIELKLRPHLYLWLSPKPKVSSRGSTVQVFQKGSFPKRTNNELKLSYKILNMSFYSCVLSALAFE